MRSFNGPRIMIGREYLTDNMQHSTKWYISFTYKQAEMTTDLIKYWSHMLTFSSHFPGQMFSAQYFLFVNSSLMTWRLSFLPVNLQMPSLAGSQKSNSKLKFKCFVKSVSKLTICNTSADYKPFLSTNRRMYISLSDGTDNSKMATAAIL